jgi:HEPN domain-containing protein
LDRLQDARALSDARRWGGTIYLAGYVVECLLKAVLLARLGLVALPEKYWHHDLERLVDEAGLRPGLGLPGHAEIRQRLTLLYGLWDVTMRYGGTRFTEKQAESALSAVEVIRIWLLGRISGRR